jgi:hypothetical protein
MLLYVFDSEKVEIAIPEVRESSCRNHLGVQLSKKRLNQSAAVMPFEANAR